MKNKQKQVTPCCDFHVVTSGYSEVTNLRSSLSFTPQCYDGCITATTLCILCVVS